MKVGRWRRGFTLIELIVVMALLTIAMAVTMPSLSRFFAGRSLTEEARRVMAVTRYARSHAVSRSVPVEVRIDVDAATITLGPRAGYAAEDEETIEIQLDDRTAFDVDEAAIDENGEATIVFLPDGTIEEGSVDALVLVNDRGDSIEIARAEVGARYIIATAEEE